MRNIGDTPPGIDNPPAGPDSFDSSAGKEDYRGSAGKLLDYLGYLNHQKRLIQRPEVFAYQNDPTNSPRPPEVDAYLKMRELQRKLEQEPIVKMYVEYCRRLGVNPDDLPNYGFNGPHWGIGITSGWDTEEDFVRAEDELNKLLSQHSISPSQVVDLFRREADAYARRHHVTGIKKDVQVNCIMKADSGDKLTFERLWHCSVLDVWEAIGEALDEKLYSENAS